MSAISWSSTADVEEDSRRRMTRAGSWKEYDGDDRDREDLAAQNEELRRELGALKAKGRRSLSLSYRQSSSGPLARRTSRFIASPEELEERFQEVVAENETLNERIEAAEAEMHELQSKNASLEDRIALNQEEVAKSAHGHEKKDISLLRKKVSEVMKKSQEERDEIKMEAQHSKLLLTAQIEELTAKGVKNREEILRLNREIVRSEAQREQSRIAFEDLEREMEELQAINLTERETAEGHRLEVQRLSEEIMALQSAAAGGHGGGLMFDMGLDTTDDFMSSPGSMKRRASLDEELFGHMGDEVEASDNEDARPHEASSEPEMSGALRERSERVSELQRECEQLREQLSGQSPCQKCDGKEVQLKDLSAKFQETEKALWRAEAAKATAEESTAKALQEAASSKHEAHEELTKKLQETEEDLRRVEAAAASAQKELNDKLQQTEEALRQSEAAAASAQKEVESLREAALTNQSPEGLMKRLQEKEEALGLAEASAAAAQQEAEASKSKPAHEPNEELTKKLQQAEEAVKKAEALAAAAQQEASASSRRSIISIEELQKQLRESEEARQSAEASKAVAEETTAAVQREVELLKQNIEESRKPKSADNSPKVAPRLEGAAQEASSETPRAVRLSLKADTSCSCDCRTQAQKVPELLSRISELEGELNQHKKAIAQWEKAAADSSWSSVLGSFMCATNRY
eukprot:TRINITY_DN12138_c0_g1_i1.p1 TRINITY_DN12138_c0_g1~~TRINITY_DN12138_c0_g1_i1.p1  ORF type:complete len:696 (-),score=226.22 TRINITY_DN12138_c0_g1_i1:74-2161(-)